MLELLSSGLLGSIFGGIFRIIPEITRLFDQKNQRSHELSMFKLQTDLEKLKGEYRLEERYVDHSVAQMDAISNAFKEQAASVKNSYKWVAAASGLVRPLVTYVLFGMYVMFKLTMMYNGLSDPTVEWSNVIKEVWTIDDFALLNMILTFWFVGRAIEKRNNG